MPAPIGIPCDLCGQKFFKRSLPIHRKQCEKKFATCYTECTKCLRKVSNDEYDKHVADCKVIRTRPVPKPKVAKTDERMPRKEKAPKDCEDDSSSEDSSDEEDSREQCGFCQRKFSADRIAKHESICATNSERKKRKQFKTASQQRLEGTDFQKYMDPSTRRDVEKPPSVWRDKHQQLQNVVEQGRLVKEFQEHGVPLTELPASGVDLKAMAETGSAKAPAVRPEDCEVPEGMKRCEHCKRTFNLKAAEKHIPKCKTTINKPKTLVRKSQPNLEKPKQDFSSVIKMIAKKVLSMKNKKNDFFETKEASMFHDGETVMTCDGRKGTVRYVGRVQELFPGYWLGVELETPDGNNDGSVEGRPYFKCEEKKGVFLRPSKVKKILLNLGPEPKTEDKKEATETIKQPATPESDENTDAPKKEKDSSKKPGLVEKLREEVRVNSPRFENAKNKSNNNNNGDQAAPVAKKAAAPAAKKAPVKKVSAAEKAKQKRLEKDVKFLEALHGKPSNAEQPREESMIGQGKTLGGPATSSKASKASSAAANKNGANRPDRAARAAYFEKMFAQKNQ